MRIRPQHSNPASLLMDMLNIGREAAYRRLRGEVPFTFGEASALCARMHFSLDRVVGLAATDKLSFQLKFKEFTALLETYNEILERDIAFMREVASDPTTEFATATNSLPAEFYGKYDNLNRFKLFKWLYQHEVGNPAVRTFEELKLPAELRRNCREYVRWVQSVATTYLIFDDSNFKHWLNALRAYREMHLISQESVRVLRDELFAMLDEMETVAVKGEFENGNKIFLYLSDIDLESSYSYGHDQQTPGREHRNVLAERTADARSADVRIREEMDQDPEPVFDAHIRQRRAAAHPLFQASARDRRPAGLTPRSRCGVSPAGTKGKGRVSQPSPRSLRMCGT